jgi:hypothetical protein
MAQKIEELSQRGSIAPAGLSRDVLEIADIEMDALSKHSARRRLAVQASG